MAKKKNIEYRVSVSVYSDIGTMLSQTLIAKTEKELEQKKKDLVNKEKRMSTEKLQAQTELIEFYNHQIVTTMDSSPDESFKLTPKVTNPYAPLKYHKEK